jgi:hypothetical protein
MAIPVEEVNAVTTKYFDKTLSVIAYDNCAFLAMMKKRKHIVEGGTEITFPVRYRQLGRADAIGFHNRIVYETYDTRTQVELEWKVYEVDTEITLEERIKNHGNKTKIVDLVKEKTVELKEDMEERFATDIFTTNANGNGIIALPVIVDSSDTYAGLSPTDAPNWASQEDSTTTTPAVYSGDATSIDGMVKAATFNKKSPNFHLTTKNLASWFEAQIEPQKRTQNDELYSLGFRNVAFHGDPVFGDPYCPANHWYGLYLEAFFLIYHPMFNFKPEPWHTLEQAGYPHNLGRSLWWVGNLKCDDRKPHFKFTALDATA